MFSALLVLCLSVPIGYNSCKAGSKPELTTDRLSERDSTSAPIPTRLIATAESED